MPRQEIALKTTRQTAAKPASVSNQPAETKRFVHKRRRRVLTSCLITLAILFVLFVSPLLYVAARSGLVTIPLLSSIVFHTPAPHHAVAPGASLEAAVESQIDAILTERLTLEGLSDRSITLTLKESEMTSAVQDVVRSELQEQLIPEKSQVAVIEGEAIELFAPLTVNRGRTAVTIGVVPTTDPLGRLRVHIAYFKIGLMNVPGWVYESFVSAPLAAVENQFNQQIGQFAKLDSIRITGDSLILSGELTIEIRSILDGSIEPAPTE